MAVLQKVTKARGWVVGPLATINVNKTPGDATTMKWSVINRQGSARSAKIIVERVPGGNTANVIIRATQFASVANGETLVLNTTIPLAGLVSGAHEYTAELLDGEASQTASTSVAKISFSVTISGWALGALTVE